MPEAKFNKYVGASDKFVGLSAAPSAPELVVNGGFADGSSWSPPGPEMNFLGGTLNAVAAPAFTGIDQAIAFEAGATYIVKFDVTARTAGNVRISFINGTQRNGTLRAAVGSYTEELVANAGNNAVVVFAVAVGSTWSIDNLSIKKKV